MTPAPERSPAIYPVDLHNHSERSKDAVAPGRTILEMAAARGVQVLGICEHDAFPAPSLFHDAESLGLRLVAGVEFSCTKSHIIGYSLAPDPQDMTWLENHFTMLERNYLDVTRTILGSLASRGIRVAYDDLAAFAGKPPHKIFLLQYLSQELGLFADWSAARRYLIEEGLYIPDNTGLTPLHPAKAVELIKRCNGVAVWAHPFFTPQELREEFLPQMLEAGLDGIETAYAYRENGLPGERSNEELATLARDWARRHGLLQSGGSDSHYPIKAAPDGTPIRPGDIGLQVHEAAPLLERL